MLKLGNIQYEINIFFNKLEVQKYINRTEANIYER